YIWRCRCRCHSIRRRCAIRSWICATTCMPTVYSIPSKREYPMTLEINDQAPDFSAAATDAETLSLRDFAGQTLVLYFYPRDNTPGCTKEGEASRDQYEDFRAAGAAIVGVSRDSV